MALAYFCLGIRKLAAALLLVFVAAGAIGLTGCNNDAPSSPVAPTATARPTDVATSLPASPPPEPQPQLSNTAAVAIAASPDPIAAPTPTSVSTPAPLFMTPTRVEQSLDDIGGLDAYVAECGRALADTQLSWELLAPAETDSGEDALAALTWGQFAALVNKAAADFERIVPPLELERYHAAQLMALKALSDVAESKRGSDSFGGAIGQIFADLLPEIVAIAFDDDISEEERRLASDTLIDSAFANLLSEEYLDAAEEVETAFAELPVSTRQAVNESCGALGVGAQSGGDAN